jgi:hypothetical protein
MVGGWRKLHNEELHNLYPLLDIIRMIKSWRVRWAGSVAHMGIRGMLRGFWWEMQKERTLGRPRHKWEDNIKIEIRWGGMDWIELAQVRDHWRVLVDMALNLWVP